MEILFIFELLEFSNVCIAEFQKFKNKIQQIFLRLHMIRPIKFIMIKSMDKTKLKLIFFFKNVNKVQKLFVLVY